MPAILRSTPLLVGLLAVLLAPTAVAGQIAPREGPLPDEVRAGVLELANDPATLRVTGNGRIPAGAGIEGDVVVLGGSLRLGGTIDGELAVVNGDLLLDPGARVEGVVRVIGGRVEGAAEATLAAGAEAFQAPLRYRIRGDRVEGVASGAEPPSRFLSTDLGFGRTRFTARADGAYNRSDGLPVRFGPIIETRGRNPLVLEAFGIWRSASGLTIDTEELGYHFTLDQGIGGRGTMSLGLEVFDRTRAVEARGLTDLESALSTFFLSRDPRDQYGTRGWSGYFDLRPVRTPVRARVAYREEEHSFASIGGPWTLGRGDEPWRPEPVIAEGAARYLDAELDWDTRDDPVRPSDGFRIRLHAVRQIGGVLRHPVPEGTDPGVPGEAYPRVTWAGVDLRRYARISPSSRIAVRIFSAGSPEGSPLPPQFQSALGGEGSLPGHPPFSLSCEARTLRVPQPGGEAGQEALSGYGCDRASLAQIEVQRLLPVVWDPVPESREGAEWAGLLRVQPAVSVFLNAGEGRAWHRPGLPERADAAGRGDIGVGLVAGALGLYWAYPLNRKDRGLNFFVRLDHRF